MTVGACVFACAQKREWGFLGLPLRNTAFGVPPLNIHAYVQQKPQLHSGRHAEDWLTENSWQPFRYLLSVSSFALRVRLTAVGGRDYLHPTFFTLLTPRIKHDRILELQIETDHLHSSSTSRSENFDSDSFWNVYPDGLTSKHVCNRIHTPKAKLKKMTYN